MGPIYNCTNKSQSNILVLKCLGLIESSSLVIVTHRPITKLGFGLGIMP
jgi:hypothetical protein